MATAKQLRDLEKKVKKTQEDLNEYAKGVGKPTQTYALEYGASGRGEFTENETKTDVSSSFGVPMSEAADFENDPTYKIPKSRIPERTLSTTEAAGLQKQFGMTGIGNFNEYAGLTRSQAEAKARQKKDLLMGQTSQLTSYSFNPETINKVKDITKDFQLKLDENINDPYSGRGTKKQNLENLIAVGTSRLADSFGSIDEFNSAYQSNPGLQKSLDSFVKAGGSLEDIQSKIQMKGVPQDWDPQTYANFKEANPNLEPDAEDTSRMQSTPDYLSSLSDGSPAAMQAEQAMFVEGELAKQEIARQFSMSNEVQRLYFGDDQTIGILEQNKKLGEEKLKLIERQVENAEASARRQADYEIDKNEAEVKIAQATIEQNRLNAKNYMTGMLAKLGALQTTGAAPVAIATLDQKYQQQKQELDSKLYFANKKIRNDLKTDVNDIETKGEEEILSIKEDLSKDEETAFKEIMKVQRDAQKEIYNITKGYVKDFKSQKDKYESEAKSNADKYISSFMTLAGKGIDVKKISSMITPNGRIDTNTLTNANFAKKSGTKSTATSKPARDLKIADDSTYKYFMTLPKAFRDMWTRDILRSESDELYQIEDINSAYDFYQTNSSRFEKPKEKASDKRSA